MKISNKLRLFCSLWLLLLGVVANKAYCNDKEELLQIEAYLNSLKHIVAKFTQVDSHDNTQKGNFFLSRPGKLKWEYQDPKKITILFNDNKIFYHDKDLDQRSEYQAVDSLIYFLITPKIDFSSLSSEYYVQSFSKTKKYTELEVKKKNQSKDETLIIKFSNDPTKLISVAIKDSIRIFIDSIIEYKILDKNLFVN
jgi:outer membrane lipoprotein-sorting protein